MMAENLFHMHVYTLYFFLRGRGGGAAVPTVEKGRGDRRGAVLHMHTAWDLGLEVLTTPPAPGARKAGRVREAGGFGAVSTTSWLHARSSWRALWTMTPWYPCSIGSRERRGGRSTCLARKQGEDAARVVILHFCGPVPVRLVASPGPRCAAQP